VFTSELIPANQDLKPLRTRPSKEWIRVSGPEVAYLGHENRIEAIHILVRKGWIAGAVPLVLD
jgi:hypothetical protein